MDLLVLYGSGEERDSGEDTLEADVSTEGVAGLRLYSSLIDCLGVEGEARLCLDAAMAVHACLNIVSSLVRA
jgi:hypothetical protein